MTGCGVGGPGSVGAAGCSRRICQRALHSSGDLRMVAQLGLDLASDFKDVRMESSSADHGTGLVSDGLGIGSGRGGSVAGESRWRGFWWCTRCVIGVWGHRGWAAARWDGSC